MIIELDVPDPSDPNVDQLTQLEGVEYLIQFFWDDRDNGYYLNFFDQDGNPIALCIKLVLGVSLLRRFTDPRLPAGMLYLGDTTAAANSEGTDIQQPADLGTRVLLFYITSDELATL